MVTPLLILKPLTYTLTEGQVIVFLLLPLELGLWECHAANCQDSDRRYSTVYACSSSLGEQNIAASTSLEERSQARVPSVAVGKNFYKGRASPGVQFSEDL